MHLQQRLFIKSLLNIRLKCSPTIILKRFQHGVQQQSSGLLQHSATQQQPHLLVAFHISIAGFTLRSGSSMRRNRPFVTGFTSSSGTGGSDLPDENRMKNKSKKIWST